MELTEVKPEVIAPAKTSKARRTDLRVDLIDNYTEEVAPDCPKQPKCESSLCKIIDRKTKLVECTYCGRSFTSKETFN